MDNRVYFYRIKTDEAYNFSPCWDDDMLSLACCKRDMRRVIGRQYISEAALASKDNAIWIVAVNGNGTKSRQGVNKIRYIAKVTEVKSFREYFATYRNRQDCIYNIIDKPNEGDWEWRKNQGNKHKERLLQEKDWDIKHMNDEKFALLSNGFRFLTEKEAITISEHFPAFTCKGVGHRYFSDCTLGCMELIDAFEKLIQKGTNVPIEEIITNHCKSCN